MQKFSSPNQLSTRRVARAVTSLSEAPQLCSVAQRMRFKDENDATTVCKGGVRRYVLQKVMDSLGKGRVKYGKHLAGWRAHSNT